MAKTYDRSGSSVAYDTRTRQEKFRPVVGNEKVRVASFRADTSDIEQDTQALSTATKMLGPVAERLMKQKSDKDNAQLRNDMAPIAAEFEAKHYEWQGLPKEEYQAKMQSFITQAGESLGLNKYTEGTFQSIIAQQYTNLSVGRTRAMHTQSVADLKARATLGTTTKEDRETADPAKMSALVQGEGARLVNSYHEEAKDLPDPQHPEYIKRSAELTAKYLKETASDPQLQILLEDGTRVARDTGLKAASKFQRELNIQRRSDEGVASVGNFIAGGIQMEAPDLPSLAEAMKSVDAFEDYTAGTQAWIDKNASVVTTQMQIGLYDMTSEGGVTLNEAFDAMVVSLNEKFAKKGIDVSEIIPQNGSAFRKEAARQLKETAETNYAVNQQKVRDNEKVQKEVTLEGRRLKLSAANANHEVLRTDRLKAGESLDVVLTDERVAREVEAEAIIRREDYASEAKYLLARDAHVNGHYYKKEEVETGLELQRLLREGVSQEEVEEYADSRYQVYNRQTAQTTIDRHFAIDQKEVNLAKKSVLTKVDDDLNRIQNSGSELGEENVATPETTRLASTMEHEMNMRVLEWDRGHLDATPDEAHQAYSDIWKTIETTYLSPEQSASLSSQKEADSGRAKPAEQRLSEEKWNAYKAQLSSEDQQIVQATEALSERMTSDARGLLRKGELEVASPEKQAEDRKQLIDAMANLGDDEAVQHVIESMENPDATEGENAEYRLKIAQEVAEARYSFDTLRQNAVDSGVDSHVKPRHAVLLLHPKTALNSMDESALKNVRLNMASAIMDSHSAYDAYRLVDRVLQRATEENDIELAGVLYATYRTRGDRWADSGKRKRKMMEELVLLDGRLAEYDAKGLGPDEVDENGEPVEAVVEASPVSPTQVDPDAPLPAWMDQYNDDQPHLRKPAVTAESLMEGKRYHKQRGPSVGLGGATELKKGAVTPETLMYIDDAFGIGVR